MDRRLHHLANTGYNSHDRDINITACHGKNIIAADTYQAVSQLHDKSGRPQTDDIPGMSGALRNLIYMNPSYLQFWFSMKKIKYKQGRENLRDDSSNRCTLNPHIQNKNKNWIKNNICHCTDCYWQHTDNGISLCIDKRIHSCCYHGRESTQKVNHQIGIRINQSIIWSTKQSQ